MTETCTGVGLLPQVVSVSGGDEDLTFSALRLGLGRQIKIV